jgi:hypothetical protein
MKKNDIITKAETTMKGKKTISLFFVLCFFIFSGYLEALDEPKIVFDNKKIDFGQAIQGVELTQSFSFENAGGSLLTIEKIRTSCGCTAALASKESLKPGEKGDIEVTFNTRGYSGEVSKYIYVYTNDPKNPRVMLSVSAHIEIPPGPKIKLNRTGADIGLILEGENIQSGFNIKNTGELELEVEFSHKDAHFFHNGKEIKKSLKVSSGRQKEVRIEIGTPAEAGPIREYILLKTNDPLRSTLSFYIRGYAVTEKQLKELFEKYKHLIREKT